MKVEQVFGVSNKQIESYIERPDVDDKFVSGLKSDKHIIVYGASKQGKTALTNKHLDESEFLRVDCSPNSQPIDIYKSVLRQLSVEFKEESKISHGSSVKGRAEIKATVSVPFLSKLSGKLRAEKKSDEKQEMKFKPVEFNLNLAQDISEILKAHEFEQHIILENFHYLEEEVQKKLAFDLRVFEDHRILFIVLGIWREKNRLAQFNGDLLDRIVEVPVEPWQADDFKKVLEAGEPLMNVDFSSIEERMIVSTFDSIGVFQELCKHCCKIAGFSETNPNDIFVISEEILNQAIKNKFDDYSSRHIRSLETFVEQKAKSSSDKPLYIAYYFVTELLKNIPDDITHGFKRKDIHELIKSNHHRPDDVRPSDITYFLHNIVSNQLKKSIVPPIFDYDRSTRLLKVIDSTFYFFLQNMDATEILELINNPLE